MKKINFGYMLIISASIFIWSCSQPNNPADNGASNANLVVTPDSAMMSPGSYITLQAFLRNSQGTNMPFPNKLLWHIMIGNGNLSSDTGSVVTYYAPSSINGDNQEIDITVTPVFDARWEKSIKIIISKSYTGNPNGGNPGGGNSNEVCFTRDILPIFETSCGRSGCHDGASGEERFALTSYQDIMRGVSPGNPSGSAIFRAITGSGRGGEGGDDGEGEGEGGIMPPPPNPPLSQDQIALIGKWISEGARNTDCSANGGGGNGGGGNGGGGNGGGGGSQGCDTTNVTYRGSIVPILSMSCTSCHNASRANAGLDLTNFGTVQTIAMNGRLFGAVSHAPGFIPMPSRSVSLSSCDLSKIRIWISKGAPNN